MKNVNQLLCLIASSLLVSCVTAPKNFTSVNSGQWEARALIKDKVKSKKFILNVDFVAERPNLLRMEISSPVGGHLASFAMNPNQVTYIVSKNKTFHKGLPNAESMKAVLGHPLNPNLINNILFDEPISSKGWSCTNGPDGAVADCKSLGGEGIEISWNDREGSSRTVFIKHSKFEIQLQFHKFEKVEKSDSNLFQITQPTGFKQI